MPNSAARLTGTGGALPSLASTLGLIKLAPRGGRGLVRSGPDTDGFRCLAGDFDLFPMPGPDSLEGLRILDPSATSDGLLIDEPWPSLLKGNV